MKKRHLLLVALSLILSICMCFGLAACSSCDDDETPTVLATPVVTIDNAGKASWEAVEGASSYAYKINDGTEVETTELSRQLTDGQRIAVKAVGDGKSFSDSEWSEAKTYTAPAPQPVTLGKPVVTIADDGTASWAAIEGASKYAYKVNGGTEQETTALSVKLEEGQSIVVKAVGNGTTFLTGEWSDSKTYTVGTNEPAPLPKPVITLTDNVVSWTADGNASGYKYSTDDGTTWTDATGSSITLTESATVIVKAIGDGTTYADSPASDPVTYTKQGGDTPPAHTNHVWGTEYTSAGAAGHYLTCTYEGCNAHSETEDHGYDSETDVTCNKCGYEREIGGDTPPEHTEHVWGTEYTSAGAAGHYLTCTYEGCNAHSETEDHGYDSETDVTCNKCGYERETETPDPVPEGTLKAETTIKDYAEAQDPAWANGDKHTEINIDGNITAKAAGGSNTGKYYTKNNDWRIYQTETPLLTISSKLGYEIVSVTITYNSDKNGVLSLCDEQRKPTGDPLSKDVAEITNVNSDKLLITVVNGDENKGVAQITAIKVIYKKVAIELGTPEVTVDDYGVVSWTAVEHADGYAYKIGDGETVTVAKDAELKYDKLTNGQSIKVWAVGDGTDYKDGKPATGEYVQTQLVMTEVTVDDGGMARWNAVEGASGYEYILLNKDGEKVGEGKLDKDTCFKQLADGQKIQVKAVGEGKYVTSGLTEPSDIFEAPAEKSVCDVPEFEIARNGEVTISTVTGAGSYEYVIIASGVEADPVNVTNLETLDLTLSSGQSIKVKAVGNDTTHTSSDYSVAVEYKKPNTLIPPSTVTVTPEGTTKGTVTVSFAEVANATGYKYIVTETADAEVDAANAIVATHSTKDGTVSFKLLLAENEFIRVLAVGNENDESYTPAGKGDYSNGYNSSSLSDATQFTIDNAKTYTVSGILPVIAYYGNKESANSFKISGTVSANSHYLNGEKGVTLTLKEGDETVNLFAAQLGADFEKLAEDKLIGITVTAEGKVKTYQNAPQFSKPAVTLNISNEQRFNLAVEVLREMKTDLEKDHTEGFTLPVTLFGATVTWSIKLSGDALTAAEAAFAIDNDTGIVTITPAATDIEIPLQAELSVDDDKYTDAESELLFTTKVPNDSGERTATYDFNKTTGVFKDATANIETAELNQKLNEINDKIQFTFATPTTLTPKYNYKDGNIQFYANNTLVISVASQTVVTQIDISYTTTPSNITADKGEFNSSYQTWTGFVTDSLTITNKQSGQVKITKIIVTYQKLSDTAIANSALNAALNNVKDSYSADFELPNTVNDLNVAWKSNNATIEITTGADKTTAKVTQPEDNDVIVTVTATVTLNGTEYSQTKDVTIKKASQGDGKEPEIFTFSASTMGNANIANANLNAKIKAYGDAQNYSTLITFNETNNSGANYNTKGYIQFLTGNTLTINAGSLTIVKIEFTRQDSNTSKPSPDTGALSNNVWEGSANSVKFTHSGKAWQISEIKVTFAE